jgi:zinc transport system permease protein
MAIGIIFIFKTPGYQSDLNSYLFGNILLVSRADLYWIVALNAVILVVVFGLYNPFLAVCFDEGFSRLRGVPTEWVYLLLLALTAITVVVLVKVVGIILAIALLTLPAAVASNLTHSLARIMLLATLLCGIFTSGGLVVSYQADLPSGATIIVLAGGAYLLTAAGRGLRGAA